MQRIDTLLSEDAPSGDDATVDGWKNSSDGTIARWYGAKKRLQLISRPVAEAGIRRWTLHGEKRSRDTHESKTDKDAFLFRKSKGSE